MKRKISEDTIIKSSVILSLAIGRKTMMDNKSMNREVHPDGYRHLVTNINYPMRVFGANKVIDNLFTPAPHYKEVQFVLS